MGSALTPIIREGPSEIRPNVDSIFLHCACQSVEISVVEVDAKRIVKNFSGWLRFALCGRSILCHIYGGLIPLVHPVENPSIAPRSSSKPICIAFRTARHSVFVRIVNFHVAFVVINVRRSRLVLDEEGSVRIHAVKVRTPQDEIGLLWSDHRKPVAKLFPHARRVIARLINGISKPANFEQPRALGGFLVQWVIFVPRLGPIAMEGYADHAVLLRFELLSVHFDDVSVADELGMRDDKRLSRRVAFCVPLSVRRARGSMDTSGVSGEGEHAGLVVCDPVFDTVAETLEADARVVDKVW